MKKSIQRHSRKIIALILMTAVLWGLGRLYFSVTDGFLVSNIVSELSYKPEHETRTLTSFEKAEFEKALSQPYYYLGKGCQSYVFQSADKAYVLKFFKYQRFRTPQWLEPLTFIPLIQNLLIQKKEKKERKLAFFMQAWKVAFDELKEEAGLIAVHLNKSANLNRDFILYDKMGFKHSVPADSAEFLIQRKADMLVPWIQKEMAASEEEKVKKLLNDLVTMLVSEYTRGLADNDHALMQNTGVYQNHPFHIDVGQFVKESRFAEPSVWHQELYNKTYKFRLWLLKNYPLLGEHFTERLKSAIGNDWEKMKPYFGRQHE